MKYEDYKVYRTAIGGKLLEFVVFHCPLKTVDVRISRRAGKIAHGNGDCEFFTCLTLRTELLRFFGKTLNGLIPMPEIPAGQKTICHQHFLVASGCQLLFHSFLGKFPLCRVRKNTTPAVAVGGGNVLSRLV